MKIVLVNAILLIFISNCFSKNDLNDAKIIMSGASTEIGASKSTGAQWSYSFKKLDKKSKLTIENQLQGKVFYEDDEFIITVKESDAFNARVKTEITFFNARNLDTISIASIPNSLKHIGRRKNTESFYFITKPKGKYDYDDAYLVLTFINPM